MSVFCPPIQVRTFLWVKHNDEDDGWIIQHISNFNIPFAYFCHQSTFTRPEYYVFL